MGIILLTTQLVKAQDPIGGDLCDGTVMCSPSNDGDMSQLKTQRTYFCDLSVGSMSRPMQANLLERKQLKTSGSQKITSFLFGKYNINVKVDTIFNSVARVLIIHRGQKVGAYIDNNSTMGDRSGVLRISLIDQSKQLLYEVACYQPLGQDLKTH